MTTTTTTTTRRAWAALAAAFLVFALAPSTLLAAGRVVAIGDIHGALGSFLTMLQKTGLADAEGHWTGGDATLVQTGDYTDRGAEVGAVMDLLQRLEDRARSAGGRVVILLGNHEAMNLIGEVRDVDPAAYAAFADDRSEKRRNAAFKKWKSFQRRRAARHRLAAPAFSSEVREQWMAARPLGYFNYLDAMRPGGSYGRWMIERPAAAQVGDSIFVHGGISPDYAELPIDDINRKVRAELERSEELRQQMIADGLILPTYRRAEIIQTLQEELTLTRAAGEDGEDNEAERALLELTTELDRLIAGSAAFGEQGPLWFRGFTKWSEELLNPYLPSFLADRGARRIVVAHTPDVRGQIASRLGDQIFLIDTGMQAKVYRGGRGSALEIDGDRVRRIYERDDEAEMTPAGALMMPAQPPPPPPPAGARPQRQLLNADSQPLALDSEAAILRILEQGEVLERKTIGVGITQPERLLLELDGVRVKAVFHDVDIQKKAARFKSLGFVADFRDSYRSQVAAYRVARLVGLDNVPPAVVRQVDGVWGSAALWIENAMMESERQKKGLPIRDPAVRAREFYDMRVFDNLIHNLDRNQTNILHDGFGKLWLIDQTRSFGRGPKLLHPERVVRCSRQLLTAMEELDRETTEAELDGIISKPEIKALFKRRDRLVDLIRSKIRDMGRERILFDWDRPPGNADAEAGNPAVDDLPPG